MKRREFIAGLGSAAALPAFAPTAMLAQQPVRPVVGFLGTFAGVSGRALIALRRGLGETGFIEGQNVAIEYRWIEGQDARVPEQPARLRI
jgi:putative tryptophan/tyrosine transport system substrate-binding protein